MRILEVDGTRADTVYLFLDATGQETGLYTLTVTVRDRVSGESADRETDLFAGVTEHYLTKKSLSRFSVRLSQVLRHRSSWLFGVLAACLMVLPASQAQETGCSFPDPSRQPFPSGEMSWSQGVTLVDQEWEESTGGGEWENRERREYVLTAPTEGVGRLSRWSDTNEGWEFAFDEATANLDEVGRPVQYLFRSSRDIANDSTTLEYGDDSLLDVHTFYRDIGSGFERYRRRIYEYNDLGLVKRLLIERFDTRDKVWKFFQSYESDFDDNELRIRCNFFPDEGSIPYAEIETFYDDTGRRSEMIRQDYDYNFRRATFEYGDHGVVVQSYYEKRWHSEDWVLEGRYLIAYSDLGQVVEVVNELSSPNTRVHLAYAPDGRVESFTEEKYTPAGWVNARRTLYSYAFESTDEEASPSDEPSRFTAFPNPTSNRVEIRLKADVAGEARLELFDTLGRRVRDVAIQTDASGDIQQALDLSGLPPGLYIARVRVGERLFSRSVTLVR
ncbi:MAG: hypothetical protein CMM84_12130 [Rhodothermaceae bacterium]|nr:hypothetical protein [Rhodothermaceae bacterium]MBC11530.1 hypothetical protein [Rhodothermaceae bacterium]